MLFIWYIFWEREREKKNFIFIVLIKNCDWYVFLEVVDEGEDWDVFVFFVVVIKFGFDLLLVKILRVDIEILVLKICFVVLEVDFLLFVLVVRLFVVRCIFVL